MVVFTDIEKARDLPEGISERFAISSYSNVLMHLFAPEQSGEAQELMLVRPQDSRFVGSLRVS